MALKKLKEYIEHKNNITDILPVIHTTTYRSFERIIDKGNLIPTPCDKFVGNDYLYLFYGKAAYVTKGKNENTSAKDTLPICFIMKIDESIISRAFPFDTGAFFSDRYSNVFDTSYNVDLFELDPTFRFINNYISTYFETIMNYIEGKCKYTKESTSIRDLAHDTFLTLIKNNDGAVAYDDRCNTIELISEMDIVLKNNVLATIIPNHLLADSEVVDFLGNIGGEVCVYIANRPHNYMNLVGKVRNLAENYIVKNRI